MRRWSVGVLVIVVSLISLFAVLLYWQVRISKLKQDNLSQSKPSGYQQQGSKQVLTPMYAIPSEVLSFEDISGWVRRRDLQTGFAQTVRYQSPNYSGGEGSIRSGMDIQLYVLIKSGSNIDEDFDKLGGSPVIYIRDKNKLSINGISGFSYFTAEEWGNEYIINLYKEPYIVNIIALYPDKQTFTNNKGVLDKFVSSVKFK